MKETITREIINIFQKPLIEMVNTLPDCPFNISDSSMLSIRHDVRDFIGDLLCAST